MDFLNPREPVSTWSHAVWLALVLPGTWLLWKRSAGDRAKQLSLLIYGLSLIFCSSASTLYHGIRPDRYRVATFAMLDFIGIYVLIAGSYTAIAWNLLRGRWRSGILLTVWSWAAAGIVLRLVCTSLPPWLSTGLYLMMGWGSVFCYVEVARRVSHRALAPILIGGLVYSLGAAINLLHRPSIWPGVFGAHELFHLCVVAASLAHFWFMLAVVVPFVYGPDPPRALDSPFNPEGRVLPAWSVRPTQVGP